MREWSPLAAAVTVALSVVTGPRAAPAGEPTAEDFFTHFAMSRVDRDALDRGEIVRHYLADDEAQADLTAADLFVNLALLVDRPYEVVASVIEAASFEKLQPATITELAEHAPFPDARFDVADAGEVERVLGFSGGRDVNVDAETLARLAALGIDAPLDGTELARFSAVYGEMLRRRYESYRRRGLDGIAPYVRGGEAMSPGDHLRITAEAAVESFRGLLPSFADAVSRFPDASVGEHRYHLIRQRYNERPLYILLHLLIERGERYLVLMHREYFVGHSYDANQMFFACFPQGDRTLVLLSADAITDEVSGFGSGLKHGIGRGRVREAAEPLLLDIRRRAEAAPR